MTKTESEQIRSRHLPLLVYQGMWESVLWPAILVLLGCVAMFAWNPKPLRPYGFLWLIAAFLVVTLLAYRWWAKRWASIWIREEDFVIRVPFQKLVVPWPSVHVTRPTVLHQHFPRQAIQSRALEPLRPYLGNTAIVVELKEWPRPPDWIRRKFGAHFLAADGNGLVLTVEDWLTLHRALDAALDAWRIRHLPPPSERFRRVRSNEG